MAGNTTNEISLHKNQNYSKIKEECLRNGMLFEDEFFNKDVKGATWLRPGKIVSNPRFFVDGASTVDAVQGDTGNCWLIVAMTNLTMNAHLFERVVPKDQSFVEDYAGVFHFRLWQCGKWVDVVIDDLLPTKGGKLIFVHSHTKNEFWCSLLEKAYAKMYGSYNQLTTGWFCEAMVDFTGGVVERICLDPHPKDLGKTVLTAFQKSSFMCCFMKNVGGKTQEQVTKDGLVKGHAYSVTRVQYMPTNGSSVLLIRLRNPWGSIEWKGAWSDGSKEWNSVPEEVKREIELVNAVDGQFWMTMKDFSEHFEYIDVCHLGPDSFHNTLHKDEVAKLWNSQFFKGEWVSGATAGGFNQDTFFQNPQYRITLTDIDDEEDDLCTIIIALMQRNTTRNIWHKIGFTTYILQDPDNLPKVLDKDYLHKHFKQSNSSSFKRTREVVVRDRWPPGVYCIIPSTYKTNMEGKYLLRIFTEKAVAMEESEEGPKLTLGTYGTKAESPGEIDDKPGPSTFVRPPPLYFRKRYVTKTDDEVMAFLRKEMGPDDSLTWQGLQSVLHYAMNIGTPSSTTDTGLFAGLVSWFTNMFSSPDSDSAVFTKDECRNMISMLDFDKSGKVTADEFQILWSKIRRWEEVFVDVSGNYDTIDVLGLKEALQASGYSVKSSNLGRLTRMYADKNRNFAFDDFVMCAINMESYRK